jgi:hypothetical protein
MLNEAPPTELARATARNSYRFVTRWVVHASRDEVFAVLTDSKSLARWWPAVYREVEQLDPPRGSDGVGKSLRLHTQGWLPYRLCWRLKVIEYQPPERLAFEASGDFVGGGTWSFAELGDDTEVMYEWVVRAEKPLLRRWSFLLKPLFASNHRWAMARGLESLELELQRRRSMPAALPPGPVSALRSWSLLGALFTIAVAVVVMVLR